ncbi:hypothetical protein [Paractinoplanes brasiliensis]|uniref:hypothetical protein n=1 Tax=Paractinoplanes brasiliensis TaxID=52695 RepID=UPI001415179F|nr:hypothetical protein [Actinoplanes brasiliensis]GID33381.1 hypothetical protein Abr02nite_83640 [Actinoplanes brasiliensis]
MTSIHEWPTRPVRAMQDTPAQVISPLGETLLQTPPAVALFVTVAWLRGLP